MPLKLVCKLQSHQPMCSPSNDLLCRDILWLDGVELPKLGCLVLPTSRESQPLHPVLLIMKTIIDTSYN